MGFIYKITNLINGKVYIGKTTRDNINERYDEHLKAAQQHRNQYLYDAMNHYGYENFYIEPIIEADNSQLNDLEKQYIKTYHSYYLDEESNGYNMTLGGDGGPTYQMLSSEAQIQYSAKLKAANTGKKRSVEISEKFSEVQQKRGKAQKELRLSKLPYQEIVDDLQYSPLNKYAIANKFGISLNDIDFITDFLFECSPQKLYKVKKKLSKKPTIKNKEEYSKSHSRGKGKDNPSYKQINNWDEIETWLRAGNDLTYIAQQLNLSKPATSIKLKEHFGFRDFRELRTFYVKQG